jgi:protein SCO1/2
MKKLMMFSLIAAGFLMSCNQKSETKNQDSTTIAATYQCPMDCEKGKTYDKPGKCSVCDMELEKK